MFETLIYRATNFKNFFEEFDEFDEFDENFVWNDEFDEKLYRN